ncbi:hypothetical protein Pmani_013218 [Petrolisthes manimaculis]|uniref:Uncharacterized protein n=1 Tax=Petrolisthes manimaculis TaxID=1843537 RepID=A0AAE1PVB9_9EUCA|nr:hypothetical protein Pmani_013218 [Petrolisthes manimaculis]
MIQEPDRQWGTDTDGVFDGVSGYLQREEVDFSAIAAPSAPRMKVANFIRSYPVDNLIIVSLQPQPLPKNLVFVRPFTGTVYYFIIINQINPSITGDKISRHQQH